MTDRNTEPTSDALATDGVSRLLEIMARLRDRRSGCPWDIAQTSNSIKRYAIEEAYEVVEAIEAHDRDALRSELGDLLFQVVFHAQIATEDGAFTFADVVEGVCEKMIDRHPHVFGDATIEQAHEQERAWEAQKAAERTAKARAEGRTPSVLDDVPLALPALLRAQKLAKRAARAGFDYADPASAREKIVEELDELSAAADSGDVDHTFEELGDVLFSAVCMAMKLDLHAEDALRAANAKFERRFRAVEARLAARGGVLSEASLAELDSIWDEIKQEERAGGGFQSAR